MFKEFLEYLGYKFRQIVTSRLFPVVAVFVVLFILLFRQMYHLQIVQGDEAEQNVQTTTIRRISVSPTRGRIYDCNGKLLAYNRLVQNVTVTDDGSYETGYVRNLMLIRLIRLLEAHGETIEQTIPLYYDENGVLQESFPSDAARLRFLRDMYGKKAVSELSEEERSASSQDIVQYYMNRFGVGRNQDKTTYEIDPATALKVIYIRYSLSLNFYVRYRPSVVARNISDETMVAIRENASQLLGVDIQQSYERVYNDAEYFCHIIGYTSLASVEEIEAMNEQGATYVSGDMIGKTGIEAAMEEALRGTSGTTTVYVNNLGQIQKVIETVDPVAGDDIYLSIDADLQKASYHLIEQKLAGILSAHLVDYDADPAASDHYIPIRQAYYQLIANNVLKYDRFADEAAGPAQQRLQEAFLKAEEETSLAIRDELLSPDPAAYVDLDSDMQDYFTAIYSAMLDSRILIRDNIDTNSELYVAYRKDGTISLQEYLRQALELGWIDVTRLDLDEKYTSSEQVYRSLAELIIKQAGDSSVFAKAIYKKLIYSDAVSRCDLALALFEQGVLEPDEEWIALLEGSGEEPDDEDSMEEEGTERDEEQAFLFLREKINNIEITPAQLALDPYSAAATVIDSTTGKVRAMVSYPGYDNNRISDSSYYASLLQDQSTPLFNSATQARTAPGSIFKPVTAAASMETGIIDSHTYLSTKGVFTAAGIEVHCWVYPRNHGSQTIPIALMNSCNDFFSQLGYRLGMVDGSYVDAEGVEKLRRYAELLGLGTKTGVEISESSPVISDVSAITSAIGQGTNLFSNVQIARYVTTIATRGTIYDLTLLDHRNDTNGNLLQSYRGEFVSRTEFMDETWDAIQYGMHLSRTQGSTSYVFSGNVDIASKTGTARENPARPNHATFISFAPYDDPEICVAVTIPNGYTSGNTAELGGYIYDYYYGHITYEDVISGHARDAGGNSISD